MDKAVRRIRIKCDQLSYFLAGAFSRMRAPIAIALSAAAVLGGIGVARASDIPRFGSGYYPGGYPPIGHRAVPYVFYDFEPGITVRPYWLPPWGNRRYYPRRRDLPRNYVRRHHVHANARRPRPAEPYYRYWSTGPDIVEEAAPGYAPYAPPLPPYRPGYFGP